VDQAIADELHALAAGHDAYTGLSLTAARLGTAGLVMRSLSNSTEELNRLLRAAAALLRRRWYGQEPLNLRKY
jgi:urease accessory protein